MRRRQDPAQPEAQRVEPRWGALERQVHGAGQHADRGTKIGALARGEVGPLLELHQHLGQGRDGRLAEHRLDSGATWCDMGCLLLTELSRAEIQYYVAMEKLYIPYLM